MKAHKELKRFLAPYDIEIKNLFHNLRAIVLSVDEDVNELIWDNYNAVAIAYSKSEKLKDAFCHLAVYSKHINLGFNRGSELDAGEIRLQGKGKLIRHLKVAKLKDLDQSLVTKLISHAIGNSIRINARLNENQPRKNSIVMSISGKKIRPSGNYNE